MKIEKLKVQGKERRMLSHITISHFDFCILQFPFCIP